MLAFHSQHSSPALNRLSALVPMLLIDRVLDLQPCSRAVILKNLSRNETFFNPQQLDPALPESTFIEMQLQSAMLLLLSDDLYATRLLSAEKIYDCHFFQRLYPGDQIRLEADLIKVDSDRVDIGIKSFVDGQKVAESKVALTLKALPSRPQIHSTSFVHPSAVLGKDVQIGPNCYIGEEVTIGDRCILEAHIHIDKWTTIGEDCHIHFGSALGGPPQDKRYDGEKAWTHIGDRNQIREYVTINRGTPHGGSVTRMGSDNLILAYVHIGHDCLLENNIIITNGSNIAGHVEIDHSVTIGGMTGIHQFSRIGRYAMIGGYSKLVKDLPPFMLCDGNPAQVHGLNLIGLRRNQVPSKSISELKEIHKILYRQGLSLRRSLDQLRELTPESSEAQHLIEFCLKSSKRSLTV